MGYQDDDKLSLDEVAPDLLAACRANYAFLVARDECFGSYDQRENLSAYAGHLTMLAFARVEGRDAPPEFVGIERFGPAPAYALETASAEEAEALVEHILKLDREAGAGGGQRGPILTARTI